MIDGHITVYQSNDITARVGINCERIEQVAPDVFRIYGLRDRGIVQVYPGMMVEFERDDEPGMKGDV